MLFVQTIVKIADNTEGELGLCIGFLGNAGKIASAGDNIVISVKKTLLNRKLVIKRKKKVISGSVYKVIVIRTSYIRRRKENFFFKNSTNAVAVLGKWGMPMGTRAMGPGHFELKVSKFPKFASICEGVF